MKQTKKSLKKASGSEDKIKSFSQIDLNSNYVHQRDKIDFDLEVRELPWTDKQKELIDIILNKNCKLLFLKGPAGTSKTLTVVFTALYLLKEKRISDIIFVRSAVESSESKLGFLPGDVGEKFGLYGQPFFDKLDELIQSDDIKRLTKEKRLTILPVNYIRGLHWAAKCVLLDEAQNNSEHELKTLLTRLGEYSRLFVLGDPEQSDLPVNKSGAFRKLFEKFNDQESRDNGIFCFEFNEEDILRSALVKFIVKKLKT